MSNSLTISIITPVPIFGILICVTVLNACRTPKHRLDKRHHSQSVTVSTTQTWRSFVQRDSAKRYWSILTDSILYFHPDYGLWARGGSLHIDEQTVYANEQLSAVHNSDSAHYNQYLSKSGVETISKNKISWYAYAIFLLGIIVGIWLLRWKR